MIKVYRQTDRIKLKVHNVVFSLKPLNVFEQSKCSESLRNEAGTQQENINKTIYYLIKYMIKDVEGIEYIDGSKIELQFDDDGTMADDSISELISMEITQELQAAIVGFVNGIPSEFSSEHVSILPVKGLEVKKKQTSTTSG